MSRLSQYALAAGVAAFVGATPANSADLGGDCCADLEERVAELEATAARKGNRKVSVTLSGHVSRGVLIWDDGHESNAYVVGNKNDQTVFGFSGDAQISSDLTAGYAITIRLNDTLSDEVSQDDDNSELAFTIWESFWFLESKKLGTVSIGKASRVTDTAPENDLSETGIAGYAGVQDMGGGFALRTKSGGLPGVTWGDLYNHLNGDTANVVRYDTPEIAGFVASASWGEDDIWDVGLKYAGEIAGITVEASVAYSEDVDANGIDGTPGNVANNTVVGSVALLHEPTGLNALVSAGHRSFEETVLDADSVNRTPVDAEFIYAKIGWLAKLNSLGATGFYGEYGQFDDFVSVGFDPSDIDAGAGAVRVAGSEAEVWGFGVVQTIDAAEMQIYAGFRHHEAEFDLRDAGGNAVSHEAFEDFQTVIIGGIIGF